MRMLQHAAVVDPVLDRITAPIVERFQPLRIVLFGSRARGNAHAESDYDIMVELVEADDSRARRVEISNAVRPFVPGVDVNVFVRTPEWFQRDCDDPGTVDWDIAREGIVLYPQLAQPLQAAAPRAIRERGKPPASLAAWLERADDDLLAIENLLAAEHVPWSAVCFHAQQTAEKYLKAVLIARWHRAPRTHKLAELIRDVERNGGGLPDLIAECETLDRWPVDARYPETVPIPTESEGRAAAAAAGRIVVAAKALLP
jgi:HEPN domain-containing protein/predicted nucleotidyltransferase